jgi:hypothetical protein
MTGGVERQRKQLQKLQQQPIETSANTRDFDSSPLQIAEPPPTHRPRTVRGRAAQSQECGSCNIRKRPDNVS